MNYNIDESSDAHTDVQIKDFKIYMRGRGHLIGFKLMLYNVQSQ